MKQEQTSDQGAPIKGGAYFSSFEQMQEPRHQAMQEILRAINTKSAKSLTAALSDAEAKGWDISRLILQDSLDSWFNLGSFLASRANLSYGKLLLSYLDFPGIDLSVQEGQTTSSFRRWMRHYRDKTNQNQEAFDAVKENVRQPISHIYLRQWAEYLPDPKPNKSASRYDEHKAKTYANRHVVAKKIFDKMSNCNVDWTAVDEFGNTVCHVLVESEASETLSSLLPWLKSLGVSMSAKNHDGFTPSDVAQMRLLRNESMGRAKGDQKDVHAFKEVVAQLERDLIAQSTVASQSKMSPRRF